MPRVSHGAVVIMIKIAILLDADAPDFYQQAAQINQFLQLSELSSTPVALWLFSQTVPQSLPCLAREVTEVHWVTVPRQVEARLMVLEQMQQALAAQLLLFAGDEGEELATRLAYRTTGTACCNVEQAQITDTECRVMKAVYNNHLRAELVMMQQPWCLSVARGANTRIGSVPGPILAEQFQPTATCNTPWLLAFSDSPVQEASPLNQARYVLAIGEGVGNAQNVLHLQRLATRLGAELAASRPVVMNAWCEMDRLLGMSGAIIAPEVCIAAGVSGAPAFSIGIRHSKFIVAINQDPQAAIFAQADVGIVAEMNAVLEELANQL
ncbi:electron transfer flavoprotein [Serratia sp. S1B]|nr:electron transfer flavoprotein [Serratia sp. S1B]